MPSTRSGQATPASKQTRANRVAAGKKAAAFVQSGRRTGRYGPEGSARGSAPLAFSIAETLARIRAATDKGG